MCRVVVDPVSATSDFLRPSQLVCMVGARPGLSCRRNHYFERPYKLALTLRPFTWFQNELLNRCGVKPLFSEPKNEGFALRRFARYFGNSQTAAEWRLYCRVEAWGTHLIPKMYILCTFIVLDISILLGCLLCFRIFTHTYTHTPPPR